MRRSHCCASALSLSPAASPCRATWPIRDGPLTNHQEGRLTKMGGCRDGSGGWWPLWPRQRRPNRPLLSKMMPLAAERSIARAASPEAYSDALGYHPRHGFDFRERAPPSSLAPAERCWSRRPLSPRTNIECETSRTNRSAKRRKARRRVERAYAGIIRCLFASRLLNLISKMADSSSCGLGSCLVQRGT